MIRRCIPLAVVSLLMLGMPSPAQEPKEISAKEAEAMRKTNTSLHTLLSIKGRELPLEKLLESLEKELPEGKKITLRIDAKALGKDAAKVSEAKVRLPNMESVSLSTMLRLVMAQVGTPPTGYRLGTNEFVVTTPAAAQYTYGYDVRDLLDDPNLLQGAFRTVRMGRDAPRGRPLDGAQRAAALARLVITTAGVHGSWYANEEGWGPPGTIRVANGNRLVIHTSWYQHQEVVELLDALRRLNDISVTVDTRLYLVDRETYTRVKNLKRPTRAEMEDQEEKQKRADDGKQKPAASDDAAPTKKPEGIGKLLSQQKMVARVEGMRILNGQEGTILSEYKIVVVPPVAKDRGLPAGEGNASLTEPQAAPEGISFTAGVVVSADRRFVQLKITEKVTDIDALPKPLPRVKKPEGKAPADIQEQVEELLAALRRGGPLEPVLSESTYSHETEIPDGGSQVMAARVRPRALEAAERWYVLIVTPRIRIVEEEKAQRESVLNANMKTLLTDILTNPRLKTTRAFYGSTDDNRWAAVSSEHWLWPEQADKPLTIPEHRLTRPVKKGKRLLGIRIDDFQWADKDEDALTVTVSLVNAGGDENGAAPGGCRLRYTIRQKENDKPAVVELVD